MRALLVIGILLAATAVARAESPKLAAARAALDQSDYDAAREALTAALASGTAGPDELAEIYRLTGTVAGALGDVPAATDAFEHLLALAPKAGLPPGTSPKIAKPFAAATAYWKAHAALATRAEPTSDPSIALVVASDPLAMIQRVRVAFVVDGAAEQTRDGAPGDRIALPAGARIDLRLAGLDARGNRVVELGTRDVPIVIVGKLGKPDLTAIATPKPPPITHAPIAPTPSPHHHTPIYAKWWLYGGLAVVAAGAATGFGLAARGASNDLVAIDRDSAMHPYSDATAVEHRGKRDALAANIGFSAAGALAIASGILLVVRF